jgi:prolyl oligopeptidase
MKTPAFVYGTLAFVPAVNAASPAQPPIPAAKPVTETLFGTTVTDPYRYFEEQGPDVVEWMKAEGRYTRSLLDSLPNHADILSRLSAMGASFDVVQSITPVGTRLFYEQRSAGSDNFDLMVRDSDGSVRKLVDVAAIRSAHGGEPFAINYFTPSNDGTKVALGISQGGSEDALLYVYDVSSGKQIAGPVPNAQFGGVSWLPGDASLFATLLTPLKAGEPETDKYKNSKVYLWDLKSDPVPILGPGLSPRVSVSPEEFPYAGTVPDSPIAFAGTANGVQNEIALWTVPVSEAASVDAPWVKIVGRDDGITKLSVVGDRIFLLSHKDAPTFKVLEVRAGQPLSSAKVVVPARPDRLIEGISAASDGLYVNARHGVYSELFKVPYDGGPEQPIELPFKGSIGEVATDPRIAGAKLIVESWAVPPRTIGYDPSAGRFLDLGIGSQPKGFDPSLFEVLDLKATAMDGVEVPLSFVTQKGARHPRPVLLWAYGSYGISQFPGFGTRTMATLPNGIDLATCHVRGGG